MDKTLFAQQVREALQNLHDFAALQNLALSRALTSPAQTIEGSVRSLRAKLLDAIEMLRPENGQLLRAKESRPYHLLYGRYVQGMSTGELVEELAISVRQLRREHKRALNTLIDLLWAKLGNELAPHPAPLDLPLQIRQDAVDEEVSQLLNQARLEELNPLPLLHGLLAVLAPVAAKFDTTISGRLPAQLPDVRADRVILRQALLEILSNAVHHAAGGEVLIESSDTENFSLLMTATGAEAPAARPDVGLNVAQQLLARLGGSVEIRSDGKIWQAHVTLPTANVSILVMDDNPGLINLFRRYLADRRISLIEAHTAAETIEIASKNPLQLAIVDVMMPEQDGWEVLHHLRVAPETSNLPIVVCSVLNEPEIAYGLGASAYLTKPVTQDAFLTLVEEWCLLRPPRAAMPLTGRADKPTPR